MLAGLVALRLAFPLALLALSGRSVPVVRDWEYRPVVGDGHAYMSSTRELVASAGRVPVVALAGVLAVAALGVLAWRRLPRLWAIPAVALAASVVLAAPVLEMERSASGGIGWPLAWAGPLGVERVLGITSDDAAFAAGFGVSLVAQAVTVVAVGYAALFATGSRRAGELAAALAALWPLLLAFALDPGEDVNNTWLVETGLVLHTEPLSTALVAAGTALALARFETAPPLAGVAFGLAAATRPTNALVALAALSLYLAARRLRGALAYVAGFAAVAPLVLAFETRETAYELAELGGGVFSLDNVVPTFADSTVHPVAFVVAVLLVAAGAAAMRDAAAAFLVASVALTAGFYALFSHTDGHPRYLLAAVPALLVLAAAACSKAFVRIGAAPEHPR